MKLSLLPLRADALLSVRCDGPLTDLGLRDPLQEFLGTNCYSRSLVMSLEGVPAIDVSGVSWLMRSHRAFQEAGGKLVLFALPPLLTKMLSFLHLLSVLHIAQDERAASALALAPRLLVLPEDSAAGAEASLRSQLRSTG